MTKLNFLYSLLIPILLLMACKADKANSENFTLKVNIKGLKKGMVYLQKENDSTIINLDSLAIKGQSEFELHTTIEEPELLYLKLAMNDNKDNYIPFFADKGITEITTSLENFNFDFEIKGSKQQALLKEYLIHMRRLQDQNLNLISAKFLAQKNKDSNAVDSIVNASERLTKRKFSHAIQFALNHNDNEIAPYIALYEIPEANPIYLDSIYKSLTEPIKTSFYGTKLQKFISENKNQN